MSTIPHLSSLPRGSALEHTIDTVARTYSRIEADQAAFLSTAAERGRDLSCPRGCGSCCEGFVPDILPAEAAFAALWLLEREPRLAAEVAEWSDIGPAARPPCPLVIGLPDAARCAIYPARPLVCRLFGFAGVRDKEGRASFRPCSKLPLANADPGSARLSVADESLERAYGSVPPVMADYAMAINALSPGDSAGRELLVSALPKALLRVGLARSLAEADADRTYSNRHGREDETRGPARQVPAR